MSCTNIQAGNYRLIDRVSREEDNHFATVLSPASKKKTGRAYVALAREYSQK